MAGRIEPVFECTVEVESVAPWGLRSIVEEIHCTGRFEWHVPVLAVSVIQSAVVYFMQPEPSDIHYGNSGKSMGFSC